MVRAACSLKVLPNTSLQSFDVLAVFFSLPCCLLWLTDYSLISSGHLLFQLYLGTLASWIPSHISAETALESSSLIALIKILILQRLLTFSVGTTCVTILSIEILPPIERTRLKRPRNSTKFTRLSNFSFQMSCDYRISLLKNNANFGLRVQTRTPSVGLPSGSERVIRLRGECPILGIVTLLWAWAREATEAPNPSAWWIKVPRWDNFTSQW